MQITVKSQKIPYLVWIPMRKVTVLVRFQINIVHKAFISLSEHEHAD